MVQHVLGKAFARYPRKTIRILEVMPPLIALFLISLPFWGAVFFPVQLAYFIIFFDIFWLYKSLNLSICAFAASRKIKEAEQADWLSQAQLFSGFNAIRHIIVIPTYQESVEKITACIDSLCNQTFPVKRLYVYIAMEERDSGAQARAEVLRNKYDTIFGDLHFTFHPDVEGEVKGKSSNQAYAARIAYKTLIEEKKYNTDVMTISSSDADSIFDPQYFAYVTHSFLSLKNSHLSFWQSANVTYNNFWKVPAFVRIAAFFSSLSRVSLLVQGLKLIPNSIYTLPFKLLVEIGYWDTDVIPEDYRIFFKAFFATGGKVTVVPVFLKTSMDAPQSHTYIRSLTNKYQQERRWSWGISDDAIYLKWWLTVKHVPFLKKTFLVGSVLIDHILWPVNWFLITISSNVIVFINPVFYRTSLGYNLPQLSGFILTLCLFALFILIYVDFDLRSKRYSETTRLRQFMFPLEFVLMPVAGFFLSTVPALISHLQLIAGKRLEYKVTEKV